MFESKFYPEINIFLRELEDALTKLPENLGHLKGFYLAYFNPVTGSMTVEKTGEVSGQKEMDYIHHVCLKVLNEAPGTVSAGGYRVAVLSDSDNPKLDQAIAFFWLIAKNFVVSSKNIIIRPDCPLFWDELDRTSKRLSPTLTPDNPWVEKIFNLLI